MGFGLMQQSSKCKKCGLPIEGGNMYLQKSNELPTLIDPGDGPYCPSCYRKLKFPQWRDSLDNMKEVQNSNEKPDKVNTPRNQTPSTSGGPRGIL